MQDKMECDWSQSKKKETRAIQEVDKWITRIENVSLGMISNVVFSAVAAAVAVGFFGHN